MPRPARIALALLAPVLALAGSPALAVEGGKPRSDYILHCAGCHGMTGEGTELGGVPAIPNSVGHIATIDIGRTYIMHVPGVISTDMTDAGIADVMNYILDHWADGQNHFTPEEVARRRAIPIGDVVTYRRKVVDELRGAGIEIAPYPWP